VGLKVAQGRNPGPFAVLCRARLGHASHVLARPGAALSCEEWWTWPESNRRPVVFDEGLLRACSVSRDSVTPMSTDKPRGTISTCCVHHVGGRPRGGLTCCISRLLSRNGLPGSTMQRRAAERDAQHQCWRLELASLVSLAARHPGHAPFSSLTAVETISGPNMTTKNSSTGLVGVTNNLSQSASAEGFGQYRSVERIATAQ